MLGESRPRTDAAGSRVLARRRERSGGGEREKRKARARVCGAEGVLVGARGQVERGRGCL